MNKLFPWIGIVVIVALTNRGHGGARLLLSSKGKGPGKYPTGMLPTRHKTTSAKEVADGAPTRESPVRRTLNLWEQELIVDHLQQAERKASPVLSFSHYKSVVARTASNLIDTMRTWTTEAGEHRLRFYIDQDRKTVIHLIFKSDDTCIQFVRGVLLFRGDFFWVERANASDQEIKLEFEDGSQFRVPANRLVYVDIPRKREEEG